MCAAIADLAWRNDALRCAAAVETCFPGTQHGDTSGAFSLQQETSNSNEVSVERINIVMDNVITSAGSARPPKEYTNKPHPIHLNLRRSSAQSLAQP